MKKHLFNDLLKSISQARLIHKNICPVCLRDISNKKHLTKRGCKWCDASYYKEKK